MRGLEGRTAFVTGGALGIGRATVQRLVEEGCRVAFGDIADGEVEGALRVACDVTAEEEIAGAVATVQEQLGPVDILVNCAAVDAGFDAVEMTSEEWDRFFALDLKSLWLCAKHVLPDMRARGVGAIVNVSSIHARLTSAGAFPYAAAKEGVLGLTRSLALDEAPHGIRVAALCPGFTRSERIQAWLDDQEPARRRQVQEAHPMGRIGEVEEIAAAIAFLASDDASFITGTVLHVDGGLGSRYAL